MSKAKKRFSSRILKYREHVLTEEKSTDSSLSRGQLQIDCTGCFAQGDFTVAFDYEVGFYVILFAVFSMING